MKLATLQMASVIAVVFSSGAMAEALSAQQIQSLIIGKRLDWVSHDGASKGRATYERNGSASATISTPRKLQDKGSWRLVGNKMCITWQKIRAGTELCTTVTTTTQSGVYRTDTVFMKPR